jgi:hypothetical protein
MRFKILALFACLLGTISPLVQASALDDLCGVIESLGSCRTAVYVPQVKVRYGTIHLVKWNSCKSRISYGFGWTCWAGFDRWDVEGPVGVDFSVRAVSLCSLTQKAIPGLPDLVKRASGVCKCLPEVRHSSFALLFELTTPVRARTGYQAVLLAGHQKRLLWQGALGCVVSSASKGVLAPDLLR